MSEKILAASVIIMLTSAIVPIVFILSNDDAERGSLWWLLALSPLTGTAAGAIVIAVIRSRLMLVQEAVDATQSAFVVYDADDRLVIGNEAYRETLRVTPANFVPGARYADMVRDSLLQTLPHDLVEAELQRRLDVQHMSDSRPTDRRYPDNRWVRVVKTRTPSGASVGVAIDVSEYYELREHLANEHRRFNALARSAPVGICQIDAAREVTFVNDTLIEMMGVDDAADLYAQPLEFLIKGRAVVGFPALVAEVMLSEAESEAEFHRNGNLRHFIVRKAFVPVGELSRKVLPPHAAAGENILILVDITNRKQAEARINYLALHDALTGAFNRFAFADDLALAATGAGMERPALLIVIDLDRFKPVNDLYGHAVGDEVLRQVVTRLTGILPQNARLYRLGGDEFAVLCLPSSVGDYDAFARSALQSLSEPFQVEGLRVLIGASIGISAMPRDTDSPETLVLYADLALYHVKRAGGGEVMMFDQGVLSSADTRRVMELDLVQAIENRDITLALQPIFGADRHRPMGAEALARWRNRRTGEDVEPATFLPIAEAANLIQRIDMQVFSRALETYAAWTEQGRNLGTLTVNLAVRTLEQPNIAEHIAGALVRCRVPGEAIVIEVTESFVVRNGADLAKAMLAINATGVRFALDDFGTGYTSLRLLADLPISFLKIDQSFVRELTKASGSRAHGIVRATIQLAQHLDLGVIAEGVEHEDELAVLRDLGCTLFQGHLFGFAVTAEEFFKFYPMGSREVEK